MDFDPFASLSPEQDSVFSNSIANENAAARVDPFSWNDPSLGDMKEIKDADDDKFDIVNANTKESLEIDNDWRVETSVISQ